MYGSFLREVRRSRGLTQAELAAVAGIEQPNLSAYENDRRVPGIDVFNRLVAACGYGLVATAGETELAVPLPLGTGGYPFDDLPARLPDDPADEPPAIALDATDVERAAAIVEVIAIAEATAHPPRR